ncbi:MAG: SCO family protein [Acidobacteriota bacterium]
MSQTDVTSSLVSRRSRPASAPAVWVLAAVAVLFPVASPGSAVAQAAAVPRDGGVEKARSRSAHAAGPGMDHSAHQAMMRQPAAATELGSMVIPDVLVRTQDGKQVHFYSDLVKGRVVAMNFIFTTCTTICPPMGANFAQLQRTMKDRIGKDVHLISVSVDPAVDTPARLKAWAGKFGAGPGWTLVTGAKPDVDRLLKALKVFTPDKEDHSPIALVGNDAAGRWTRLWGLAPPDDLARTINTLAADHALETTAPPGGER